MEQRNKIILFAIIFLTIVVVGIGGYAILKNKNLDKSDADKFRIEYMELNDKINENLDLAYPIVNISEKNTIKYLNEKEAINFLKNDTGIIYFGYSTCPWCRSLVTTLTDVASSEKEIIYYLDISKIRSTYTLNDSKLEKTKNGTSSYYEILKILDDNLEEFYLEDEEGNKYDTNEKRIYAPTLVAVKKGKVIAIHTGTVESQQNGYDKLTDDEEKDLAKIIKNLIKSIK